MVISGIRIEARRREINFTFFSDTLSCYTLTFNLIEFLFFTLCSFGLTQKNQKVKTQQSSYRTRPDAGPLLRQPPRLSKQRFVHKSNSFRIISYPFHCLCFLANVTEFFLVERARKDRPLGECRCPKSLSRDDPHHRSTPQNSPDTPTPG